MNDRLVRQSCACAENAYQGGTQVLGRAPVRQVQKLKGAGAGQMIDRQGERYACQAVTPYTNGCLSGHLAGEGVVPVKFQTFQLSYWEALGDPVQ